MIYLTLLLQLFSFNPSPDAIFSTELVGDTLYIDISAGSITFDLRQGWQDSLPYSIIIIRDGKTGEEFELPVGITVYNVDAMVVDPVLTWDFSHPLITEVANTYVYIAGVGVAILVASTIGGILLFAFNQFRRNM